MRLPGDNWNVQDCRKRLIFDTSSLNALADDGESQIIAKALGEGFLVRLSETNIGGRRQSENRTAGQIVGALQTSSITSLSVYGARTSPPQ
jgi:hypothetical protein